MLRSASSACSAYLSFPSHNLCFWFVEVFIVQFISSALSGFWRSLLFCSAVFVSQAFSAVVFFGGCQQKSSLYYSGLFAVVSFFCHRFGKQAGCLTQRAPDVWESARFTSIFLASGFFYISNLVHARPHAGNANRWATRLANYGYCKWNVEKHKTWQTYIIVLFFGFLCY